MKEKVCTYCNLSLPLARFFPRKKSPDGLTQRCKTCLERLRRERIEQRFEAKRVRGFHPGVERTPPTDLEKHDARLAGMPDHLVGCGVTMGDYVGFAFLLAFVTVCFVRGYR
jgi:hypothetical protein